MSSDCVAAKAITKNCRHRVSGTTRFENDDYVHLEWDLFQSGLCDGTQHSELCGRSRAGKNCSRHVRFRATIQLKTRYENLLEEQDDYGRIHYYVDEDVDNGLLISKIKINLLPTREVREHEYCDSPGASMPEVAVRTDSPVVVLAMLEGPAFCSRWL